VHKAEAAGPARHAGLSVCGDTGRVYEEKRKKASARRACMLHLTATAVVCQSFNAGLMEPYPIIELFLIAMAQKRGERIDEFHPCIIGTPK